MDNFRRRFKNKDGSIMTFIDLGLPSGTWWAECNMGADTPDGYGLYYSRSNVVGHVGGSYNFNSTNFSGTPGSSIAGNADIPSNTTYDAATLAYGPNHQIPTIADAEELKQYCTYSYDSVNNLHVFTSTINGNSISFPSSGYYNGTTRTLPNNNCFWVSTGPGGSSTQGQSVNIRNNSDYMQIGNYRYRYYGLTIRPVYKSGNANAALTTPAYAIIQSIPYESNTGILPFIPQENYTNSRIYDVHGDSSMHDYIVCGYLGPTYVNPYFNFMYVVEFCNIFGDTLLFAGGSDWSDYCNITFKQNVNLKTVRIGIYDAGSQISQQEADGYPVLCFACQNDVNDNWWDEVYNPNHISDIFDSQDLQSFENYVKQYWSDFSLQNYDIPVRIIWSTNSYVPLFNISGSIIGSGGQFTYRSQQINYILSGTIDDSTRNVTLNYTARV